MNCPGHFLLFGSEMRSYKDLPLRFHEQTPLHRNEASGVLTGLTRVRQFSQDDGHCFVTEEQIGVGGGGAAAADPARLRRLRARLHGEALDAAGEVPRRSRDVGSRRGRRSKQALERAGQAHTINEGDGAFYGPKIDFDITDALGRKWQCGDDSARLHDAAALRPEIHRRRQRRASAGGDPPRHLRQHRALHRHPDRALRRRLPALVGAGAGDRAADCGSARRVRASACARSWPTPGCGWSSTPGRRRSITRFARPSCRRCPTCWSSATARRPKARWRCAAAPKGDLGARPVGQFLADALAEVAAKTVS